MPNPTENQEDTRQSVEIGGLHIAPGSRIGPYVYRRAVGKGGMAQVLLADDPDGQPVALKVLKANRVGSGLNRFKREFKALSRLRHPNVIRVDAYGDIHGHPYIVMEYVDGTDLHHLLHELRAMAPAARWKRAEEVLVDISRALAYIHRRGLVHRDLKPSNVLIDRSGRCKLTDFGIVKALDPGNDTNNSTTLVGTWAYASPEQMSGQPIDHRSDLYSLGVILFAMVTGRRPFVAKDLAGYLELHRTHEAPSPGEVDPDIPAHLDDICRRLLRRSPRDRFRSAKEVLFRAERLDAEEALPARSDFSDLPLVGRGAEADLLHNAVAALTRGEGGLFLVEGAQGIGRSRMLTDTATQAQLLALPVYRERVAQLDGPLGPILRLANTVGASLGRRAPRDLGPAALACLGDSSEAVASRPRLFDALAHAFTTALEEGPQVVLIDDLQHASLPMIDGLLHLRHALADAPLLMVATIRTEATSPRFSTLRSVAQPVRLGALPKDALGTLSERLVGPGRLAEALARRLAWECQGVPAFLVHYLSMLATRGVLVRDNAGAHPWRLLADEDEIRSGHWEVPQAVRDIVVEHLSALEADERQFAEALTVHGREADVDVLMEVLDLDEDSGARIIDRLVQAGFLVQRRAEDRLYVDFVQPKYAGVLYRELDTEQRAELHRRIATALGLRHGHAQPAAAIIAQHYLKAGENGRAYEHLARAARRQCDRGALNDAAELAEAARVLEDPAEVELDPTDFARARRHVEEVRADVFFTRGDWEPAREALAEVIDIAEQLGDEPLRVRARLRLARVLRALGDIDGAEDTAREWLGAARELHERDAVAEGLLVLGQVAWTRGRLDQAESAFQEGIVHAVGKPGRRIRAHLLLGLSSLQIQCGQLATAVTGLGEAESIYRELRMPGMRSVALATLADAAFAQGDIGATLANAEEAATVAGGVSASLGRISSARVLGQLAATTGRASEARALLERARADAATAGVVSEQLACVVALAELDMAGGHVDAAKELLDENDLLGADGDPERFRVLARAIGGWARAAHGKRAAARVSLADAEQQLEQLPELRRAQVALLLSRGWQLLGDELNSMALARKSARVAASRGLRLAQLDALVWACRLETDPAARLRLYDETTTLLGLVAATVPPAWRESFRERRQLDREAGPPA